MFDDDSCTRGNLSTGAKRLLHSQLPWGNKYEPYQGRRRLHVTGRQVLLQTEACLQKDALEGVWRAARVLVH